MPHLNHSARLPQHGKNLKPTARISIVEVSPTKEFQARESAPLHIIAFIRRAPLPRSAEQPSASLGEPLAFGPRRINANYVFAPQVARLSSRGAPRRVEANLLRIS